MPDDIRKQCEAALVWARHVAEGFPVNERLLTAIDRFMSYAVPELRNTVSCQLADGSVSITCTPRQGDAFKLSLDTGKVLP